MKRNKIFKITKRTITSHLSPRAIIIAQTKEHAIELYKKTSDYDPDYDAEPIVEWIGTARKHIIEGFLAQE